MAETRGPRASDIVEGLGQDDKKLSRSQEAILKKKLELEKKYNKLAADDNVKYQEKVSKELERFKRKLDAETFSERKKRWEEEAKYATSLSEKIGASLKANAATVLTTTATSLNQGIDKYLGAYSQYMTGISTRLQGSTKTFSDITSMISRNIGSSQYVSQTEVLKNLSNLVSQGIEYNVEQRAFLATVSDKIATTFDAFNSNLSQIIKIQQADSTAARLGLESSLTKFFNRNFGDTSYLNTLFDTVSAELLGAESQLGRNRSVEFEYNVQKWLGSLSAVGVSDATIQSLAKGINYLGTGDISSLSSNEALQRLFIAGSQAAGLNYSSILTGGITSTSANTLLQGIVQVMQSIASTSNQVVRSQYANLFGISMSDMTAVLNLTDRLANISNTVLSYSGAVSEAEAGIKTIGQRMSLQDRIDTMFSNVMSTIGEGIAKNAGTYTTWLLTDLVQKSGVDLSTTVLGTKVDPIAIAKGAIVGLSTISNLGAIVSGLTGKNKLSLENWGAQDILTRGWGFTGLTTTGITTGTSQSMFVGDTGSGLYEEAITSGKAAEAESVAGEQQNELLTLLRDRISVDVRAILNVLQSEGITIKTSAVSGLSRDYILGL